MEDNPRESDTEKLYDLTLEEILILGLLPYVIFIINDRLMHTHDIFDDFYKENKQKLEEKTSESFKANLLPLRNSYNSDNYEWLKEQKDKCILIQNSKELVTDF